MELGKREEDCKATSTLYEKTGYILDTHTAVASSVYGKYKAETKDDHTTTVIASTQVRSNSAEALWMRTIQNTIQWKSLN